MSAKRKMAVEIVTKAIAEMLPKGPLLWESKETIAMYGMDLRMYYTRWIENALAATEICLEELGKHLEKP